MNHTHDADKRQVRNAFGRAAASYDQAAILQREICDRMLSRLDYVRHVPGLIVDVGSGTGRGSRELRRRYAGATVVALDIALPMHQQARRLAPPRWRALLAGQKGRTRYVCADMEQMPLRDACAGLVWSNLALQWCNDLGPTLGGIHRILQTDGLFMFSTFGPDTLKELRAAFRGTDRYNHVNRFLDMHDIGDMLVHAGFATPVMDMEYFTLTYDDAAAVMRDLKAIGAHTVLQGRRRGLMGRRGWQRAVDTYEALRTDGKLPATFEVVYGHAWKPQPRTSIVTPELRRQLGLI
ncbi:malonyl-ACP O-methyltransferase BioC [Nitrosovibrio sp. Nv17]|jgi:malonyl-CoA O-methyltransferase|uniref:malonyl-ACP O-methyltransferase BioC n=1 Tax=Nitrosovibrio sp. Nv17 TaxID=1855339 RepID=UPI000908DA2B|nr:malonyl-ACP O-methyltransferase BioC [Nitrosovibrio sp. Nv17]SFW35183.1 malonyl-CoA O-methyltransferase [Nitrosovibrio sp. Nv17]